MRAICSQTASISGRASGVERISTSQPGRTPTERSTSRRAYSSMRGSRTASWLYSDFGPFTTVSGGQRAEEVLDLQCRQRLDPGRAAGAEGDDDDERGERTERMDVVGEPEPPPPDERLAERRALDHRHGHGEADQREPREAREDVEGAESRERKPDQQRERDGGQVRPC